MTIALLLMLAAGDPIVLKEKASVSGRWIRLVDLLDAERTAAAVRVQLADLYLGRAPEEGQVRTLTADEIRREMERRGVDPSKFVWQGDRVEVGAAGDAASLPLKMAVAAALKLRLQDRERLRADEVSVRVLQIQPETAKDGVEVIDAKLDGSEFSAVLSDGAKVAGLVRILRARDVVVAARDLAPGRPIERADLEVRRKIVADDEPSFADAGSVVGAVAAGPIRKDAPVTPADLRLKAVVRKGDVVRVVSAAYEVDARALEEGAPGQEISLEFATSHHKVRARVVSASRVEAAEGGR